MHGVEAEIGTMALQFSVAVGSAALPVAVCVLAFMRAQSTTVASRALRAGFVVVGASARRRNDMGIP
jgi:hypothetical protein